MESSTLISDNELQYLAQTLLEKYKQKLFEQGINASGELASSATQTIKAEGDHICVYFNLADYWQFVENGRQPGDKFPPPDKIAEWIRVKPIVPHAGKNGKVPSTKQLAYLIGRKIVVEGIKPKNVLSNTLEENEYLINLFADKIAELLKTKAYNIIDTL